MNTTGVSSEPVLTTSPGVWLICRVGDRQVAVPLDCVVETMRPLPLRVFSGSPHFVLGVSLIRGLVVPVIDVAAGLGQPGARPARFVTIRLDDRIVALAVDAVLGVQALDPAALHEVPTLLGSLVPSVLGAIGALDSGLLLVLRDARLVPDAMWAKLDEQVVLDEQPPAGLREPVTSP